MGKCKVSVPVPEKKLLYCLLCVLSGNRPTTDKGRSTRKGDLSLVLFNAPRGGHIIRILG